MREAGSIADQVWMVKNIQKFSLNVQKRSPKLGIFESTVGGGKRLYFVEAAQKVFIGWKLTAHGRAGHGSCSNDANAVISPC